MVVFCTDCTETTKTEKIPDNASADAVEFEVGSRIGLAEPCVQELQKIDYVRHYYKIINIESSSQCFREHQKSAIKVSSILFEQDAPQVVYNLLSPKTTNSNVLLHFVGYKGEFYSLYKKTMQGKLADVFGRS